jgi:hypothetical protein
MLALLRIPGRSPASKSGLRPFSSCILTTSPVTSACTAAESVCSTAAVAVTETISVSVPTARSASSESAVFGANRLCALSKRLNPTASTFIVYRPGGRLGAT